MSGYNLRNKHITYSSPKRRSYFRHFDPTVLTKPGFDSYTADSYLRDPSFPSLVSNYGRQALAASMGLGAASAGPIGAGVATVLGLGWRDLKNAYRQFKNWLSKRKLRKLNKAEKPPKNYKRPTRRRKTLVCCSDRR